MSLMAGFDFLTELSNTAVLKLIKGNLTIQGKLANPPFEINIPISTSSVNGSAHIIVTDLQLALNADDTITLTLLFKNTSVHVTSPLTFIISALDGKFAIKTSILLTKSSTPNQMVLAVNLQTATGSIDFTSNAQTKISNAFKGTPLNLSLFTGFATQAFTQFIQNLGFQTFPLGFNVMSGTNGSLSPSLQFEKLEVHCISNSDQNKQALGLFGILLVANHSKGDHTKKKATAITANHDVCMSISPETFHSLLFCPAVAKELVPNDFKKNPATAISKLPTTCGSSGGVQKSGVTVTNLSDSFANGHIDINGSLQKSGFCYEADGSFHGTITLSVSGATLTPTLVLDTPKVSISIDWYCWLAAGAILGTLGIVITAIVNSVANTIINDLAQSALQDALGKGLSGIGLGGISGVSFDNISITSEGLTINGNVNIQLPAPSSIDLKLKGSVTTSLSTVIKKGTFHNTFCAIGDYPYEILAQAQVGTYEAMPTLLGKPLSLEWQISAGSINQLGVKTAWSKKVSMPSKSGTAKIPTVETYYPQPLPNGTPVTQTVEVGYSISGNTITLTNRSTDGNYYFWLDVKAKDPVGNQKEATIQGRFEGYYAKIGGDFHNKMAKCLDLLNKKFKTMTFAAHKPELRDWVPINYPRPDELVSYIEAILDSNVAEADEILTYTKLLHGNSYYRALGSLEARMTGLPRKQKRIQQ